MKTKHQEFQEAERTYARATLAAAGVAVGQDFYTLSGGQVNRLLEEADRVKYRRPKDANGSRGRYFHALLQRRAAR